jgi:endonuclease-3
VTEKQRQAAILKGFEALYPEPASELHFSNERELVIAVLLSAQCTDKKVNEVTPTLFSRFTSFSALARARITELEKILRPINYYRTKAKNVQALGALVEKEHGGKLPRSFDELITLPGVGRKTANVVLNELGIAHALPVDTHVFRVAQRLGLAKGTKPGEIEEALKKRFPAELWRPLHHWLILHGRRVCKAQRPLCEECSLLPYCPFGTLQMKQLKSNAE